VGRWAWWLSLRPSLYSVLDTVYPFIVQRPAWEVPTILPPSVMQELATLIKLAPLVRAELGFETSPRVYSTDACLSGGGVVYTDSPPDKQAALRRLFRESASWEGATRAGQDLADLCETSCESGEHDLKNLVENQPASLQGFHEGGDSLYPGSPAPPRERERVAPSSSWKVAVITKWKKTGQNRLFGRRGGNFRTTAPYPKPGKPEAKGGTVARQSIGPRQFS